MNKVVLKSSKVLNTFGYYIEYELVKYRWSSRSGATVDQYNVNVSAGETPDGDIIASACYYSSFEFSDFETANSYYEKISL